MPATSPSFASLLAGDCAHVRLSPQPNLSRWSLRLGYGLVVSTWLLMILGAATRAARAGVACPDWPRCHGRWLPPLDAAFYPADPNYAVYRVYLEFVHRAVAGLLAMGTAGLGVVLWRRGMRRTTLMIAASLLAQIGMGAITVWLRNAPFTVVFHLAFALVYLTVLVVGLRPFGMRLSPHAPPPYLGSAYSWLAVAILVQLLLGSVVSSRSIGLACFDFPLCNGLPVPVHWTEPLAWQMAHRTVAILSLLGSGGVCGAARFGRASRRERALTSFLCGALAAQVLLGGMNVWFRIPPVLSAAHLGIAVAVLVIVVERALARWADKAVHSSPLSSAISVEV